MEQVSSREAKPALHGARMLIVEDDYVIGADLKSVLTDAGAEVVCVCRTVEDALARADEDDFAAALLDFRLGRETAVPVAHQLAARGVPFVFYSGHVEAETIQAEWPHCRIIQKPARPRTIVAAVADLLTR